MSNYSDVCMTFLAGGGDKTFTTAPATVTGNFRAILFCRNSQIASLVAADITNAAQISSKTSFSAGFGFTGTITKVTTKGGALFLIK